MNRLHLELQRLYGLDTLPVSGATRVLVLEVALPTAWPALAAAWRGVQSDLALPAPGIVVSGVDGLQLWFGLATPATTQEGDRFLAALRARYLAEVPDKHVRVATSIAGVALAPPRATAPDRWSAFVTADLASVFDDTPWLDMPPNDEGQATLLRTLAPIARDAFEAALALLTPDETAVDLAPAPPTPGATSASRPTSPDTGPADFLRRVMNDETAPLALRVEAAKALLPYAPRG